MKVYLAVPLKKNRNRELAEKLVAILEDSGNEVSSPWVTWDNPNLDLKPFEIYERDISAIKISDLVIAEVSEPSIGVGVEIMFAHTLGKSIICVYRKSNISNMILGMPGISFLVYDDFDDLYRKILLKISPKD